jgi:hypothetical protein
MIRIFSFLDNFLKPVGMGFGGYTEMEEIGNLTIMVSHVKLRPWKT